MKTQIPSNVEYNRIAGEPGTRSGAFCLKRGSAQLRVICSDGFGWDHVSVSLATRCPTWDEMCYVKDQFLEDHEVVMQLHPAKAEHVNNHPYCLHLWRPQSQAEIETIRAEWGDEWIYGDLKSHGEIPTPPSLFVGLKALNI